MWPGLVGKGPDSEPRIDLDEMLDLLISQLFRLLSLEFFCDSFHDAA
jgi:hypothetical protein